jgi:predicted SprT family Zn-dependent metalloprotease
MPAQQWQHITGEEYTGFEGAYLWFNQKLFEGMLPPCLITLQRKAKSYGYFANDRFEHRLKARISTDELALNPDTFGGRSDREILSTLVHEMCHCWQRHFGTPSRTGYHNKEWAVKMVEVGLMPSHTGAPAGKKTGQKMSHYIIAGGPFDQAVKELRTKRFRLNWQSLVPERQTSKSRSKTKFTCPACRQNAWAKPESALICGHCEELMEAEHVYHTPADY